MEGCVFCKIAGHEIPSQIVHEDEEIVAFKDVHPMAPTHIVIIPRRHIPGVLSFLADDALLAGRIVLVARKLADDTSIAASGFRIVVNSGANAGQSVPHVHFHLLGGRAMGWPPG